MAILYKNNESKLKEKRELLEKINISIMINDLTDIEFEKQKEKVKNHIKLKLRKIQMLNGLLC